MHGTCIILYVMSFIIIMSFILFLFPQYELLICVHEEKDPAVKIVEPLMERYPNVDARLFLGECLDSDCRNKSTRVGVTQL